MKVVLQRATKASVTVENKIVGSIGEGLLLLVGIHEEDTEEDMRWICDKILKLRVFNDQQGKMNECISDMGGELLVVSQFTLYGDASKGNRPSYMDAAEPDKAEKLYDKMVAYLEEESDVKVQTGIFGAYMKVSLDNDGPVTIILEK